MTTKRRQLRNRIRKMIDAHGWPEVPHDKAFVDAIADACIDILVTSRKRAKRKTKQKYKEIKRQSHTRLYTVDELCKMPYAEYLQTRHWQEKRQEALRLEKYKCHLCNARGCELHVHHLTYKRRGCELQDDLMVLCDKCHTRVHQED